jgi:hypothetical protein
MPPPLRPGGERGDGGAEPARVGGVQGGAVEQQPVPHRAEDEVDEEVVVSAGEFAALAGAREEHPDVVEAGQDQAFPDRTGEDVVADRLRRQRPVEDAADALLGLERRGPAAR